ncbi:MAG: RecX family transcriptional regulator [Patescibacteria group bacterium]|nr:RecX family transcriptional regulator [Patescibacteria group bacterium]
MKVGTVADPRSLLSKAINLLSYRPRSVAEIKQRGLAAAIPQLIELDLLDDQKFARWWVDQRLTFRPKGNRALTAELLAKGIDREIIASVMLTREEETRLAKKLLVKKNLDKPHAQRYLLARGFSSDIVFQLI